MSAVTEERRSEEIPAPAKSGRWLFGLLPLVLLAGVVAALVLIDPIGRLGREVPPVEELTFTKVTLNEDPHEIVATVRNGGPDPVTIAQVLVDDAYWTHEITPSRQVSRLGQATVRIPYPWVEGEAHTLMLISETGVVFEHEVAVATETPTAGGRVVWTLALIGLFVGVIPVFVGLMWLPFIRRASRPWIGFFLALTAGLLVFLAVDAGAEAVELSGDVPGAFQGIGLVALGVLGALTALAAIDGALRKRRGEITPLAVATLVAVGIGLHNLGEGLAIGAAYALGEVALSTFLILGFTLHNVTEGLGIVAPLGRTRPKLWHILALGAVAGVPTIFGTWIGGLSYSPVWGVLFLSLGVGAIIQVVWEIAKMMRRDQATIGTPLNAAGFAAGVLVMYVTAVFVAA